jgi:hypothetical protein
MRTLVLRRVVPAALAALVALSIAVPVDARSPVRKIEPRRVTSYRVGRAVTPDTDVLSSSGYAAWMIDEALGATTSLPKLGAAFMRAERTEKINARYLVAHALLESGWGTSDIARLKHNLFGYGAYDRGPWRYAVRFRTYAKGIAGVARRIHDEYLTASGRWWYGFTTLRAINRYYASDPHWAEKVAVLANVLDDLVVTLHERHLRFGTPVFGGQPTVGAPVHLDVRWRAKPGAVLPKGIHFAVRWTPVALAEGAASLPSTIPAPRWVAVRRTDRPGHDVRLALRAPALPGVWRVDVEARDSDGTPLPASDNPRIRSITVRVGAVREAGLAIAGTADGHLDVTIRNLSRAALPAGTAAAPTVVEAWSLPLDPGLPAYRLGAVPLGQVLRPRASTTVRFAIPTAPAVVVVRLAGDPTAVGRSVPTAALVGRGRGGRASVAALAVASPDDDRLLRRVPAKGRITLVGMDQQGSLEATIAPAAPLRETSGAIEAAEGIPGDSALLVRSVAAEPGRAAAPSRWLDVFPADLTAPAKVAVSGLPAGVRLVVAGIVPPDGGPVSAATLRLAWIRVAAAADPPVVAH